MKRTLLVILLLLLWPVLVIFGMAVGGLVAGMSTAKAVADVCMPRTP